MGETLQAIVIIRGKAGQGEGLWSNPGRVGQSGVGPAEEGLLEVGRLSPPRSGRHSN